MFEEFLHSIKEELLINTNALEKDSSKKDDFWNKFIPIFTQTCLLPRMLIEPSEAIYSAKFLITLFRIK